MSRSGAARRAHHAARRRPRDDGLGAVVDLRALSPGIRPCSRGSPTRSAPTTDDATCSTTVRDEALRRRPGAADRDAATAEGARRGRREHLRARRSRIAYCIYLVHHDAGSTRTRTRSGRSASSTRRPAPTRGCRSAAACAAASARASRSSRCGSSCGIVFCR